MSENIEMSYFLIPLQSKNTILRLNRSQRGDLFELLLLYASDDTIDENKYTSNVLLVYDMLKPIIDEYKNKYIKRVQSSRKNGKKGGRPKKPTGFSENPEVIKNNLKNPIEGKGKGKGSNVSPKGDNITVTGKPVTPAPASPLEAGGAGKHFRLGYQMKDVLLDFVEASYGEPNEALLNEFLESYEPEVRWEDDGGWSEPLYDLCKERKKRKEEEKNESCA